jgi:hypothetical protein
MPSSARVFMIKFFDRSYVDAKGATRGPGFSDFNSAINDVASEFQNVTAVDINSIVNDAAVRDRLHFDRETLFHIYQAICRDLFQEREEAMV